MQYNATKESFKLLQLSDTSKSSELELPEVTTQRKRRIRRKVRTSASPHLRSYNASHKDSTDDMQPACQNIGLWIAVFMSCGWLLILSYMMAVVYTENRRLEVEISKLSTSSQSVPDALQKWHETSKGLQQNQTSMSSIVHALQKRIDAFETDLNIVKAAISKKEATSEENNAAVVAVGAKYADLRADVDSLKEKLQQIKADEDVTQTKLTKLAETFNTTTTIITAPSTSNNETMKVIENFTSNFTSQISSLSKNVSTFNDTLTQRSNALDVDVRKNKERLDGLEEKLANVTSKIGSLEFRRDRSVSTVQPSSDATG
ncbi:uncharacterized protein LOC119068440 [Bradysia coprophila]|uniref:uncharacterized protein LOC119068440 n=1 Tax=Bradysia coprophila TaxID=38358 RepID=UPI00187DCD47|nr:uncharacterized protein LOC119068440 [Bradysia coprophila]